MFILAVYRGISITESNGKYSPHIDPTIKSTSFEKIMRWIDRTCGYEPKKRVVDSYIIGEFVMRQLTINN